MTRIRRLPLASRVCIGVFLLLFSAVAADTIKGPPDLEGLPPIEAGSTNQKEPGLSEPSTDQTALGSAADNERPVNSTKQEEKEPGRTGHGVTKAPRTEEEEEEKVRTAPGKGIEVQGIRSHEVDRLSTSDPNNGGPRFEKSHYGAPGRNSSTKALSEDFYRLSRTNGLTTVTTKPGLEEPRAGERRNWTTANPFTPRQTGNGTREPARSSPENAATRTKDDESGGIRSRNRLEKGKLIAASTEVRDVEEEEEAGEKEPTTPRGFQESHRERSKPEEYFGKNSEALDLEKVRETKEDGESISLINDTYVNYSHYYKTLTGKDLEPGSGNQSAAGTENGTNFISEDVGVSHGARDPKEEVEVVRNVTQPPTERIIEKQFAGVNSTTARTAEAKFDNELSKIGQNSSNGQTTKSARSWPDSNSTSTEEAATGIGENEDRSKLEVATIRTTEEQGPARQGNSSLIPRGRTIAFSGVNEFSSQETKTTATPAKEIDTPPTKKNTSLEKTIEQKPYPYTKSTRAPPESTTSGLHSTGTTSGGAAYENAIDRGDSEKKVVVTEPSVVIENSIQQYKSSEKAGNESLNFTTESQSRASMTTASLATVEVLPTNQTFVEKPYTDLGAVGVKEKEESGSSAGNDVPGGNEGSKVITGKDENFDVTGNGITEVSLKPESSDNANNRPSYETSSFRTASPSPANGTTEVPSITNTERTGTGAKMATNVDVQTDAEESLLIRSTLNVSEVSTEYPLTRETERTKLDKPIVSASTESASILNSTSVSTENTTVIPRTTAATQRGSTANVSVESTTTAEEVNGTNEISSGLSPTTLNPDESSPPSTTSIEYEFVGLSEATVPAGQNTTESMPDEQTETTVSMVTVPTTTVPTVQGLATQDYSDYPSSTLNSESTMDGPVSTTETVPNVENFTTAGPDRSLTLGAHNTTTTTTGLRIDSTESPLNETETEGGRTDLKGSNETVTDSWNGTEAVTMISTLENNTLATTTTTIDARFIPVTEISTRDSPAISSTTSSTTKSSTVVSSSLPPRIFVSGTWETPTTSGDAVTGGTDDAAQNLSPDEITSLVRIVMKGTCEDVYPHLEKVRTTLAEMLEEGTNVSVHARQIIFHQNPCHGASSPSPTPTDMPLTSILVYVVDQDGKFDSALTNMLPSLYKESRVHFPVAETDSGNAIAVVVVSSVAFICLILLAGLLFIMRKRQTRFNYGERCRPVSLDAYSLDSVSAYNSVRRKGVARSSKRSYGNPTFEDSSAIPSHPLNFAGLSSFCNDVNAINEEFSSIPQVSAKIDELPTGAELKNRYANVIPLPETRVPLQRINNDPLTEYINANYVRGPRNATRYYIACQAPMDSTVTDFWRMVWEQQCKVIIMLTDLVENGVEKCTEYIPPSEVTDCHRLYGDYQVTLKKRETKEKYAISTLHLKNLENNTFREVFHIWYLWPVNAVQSDGTGLIAVILEARALQRGGPGSIVVHCSPGTGRTGTLIALDLGIRQYEITRTVDVPRVVYTIRRDRAGAVQTKEQYAFIYKALNLYATKLAGGVLEST